MPWGVLVRRLLMLPVQGRNVRTSSRSVMRSTRAFLLSSAYPSKPRSTRLQALAGVYFGGKSCPSSGTLQFGNPSLA
jgi:hypothetical protein